MKKNLLKAIVCDAWRILFGYIGWMKRFAVHPDKYPMEQKYQKLRKLVIHIAHGFDIDVIPIGLENVPKETSAFFSNHLGAFDPVGFISLIESPTAFLAKDELDGKPFISTAIKSIECLFLKRDDLKESLRTMMKIQEDFGKERKNWLIYPEGTRNKDDRALLLEFHHGTFRPAMKAQVPLVPVATFGSQRIMDKNCKFKKYPLHVVFGKPIYPDEYKDLSTQEVAAMVQSRVQSMLTYIARKKDRAYLANLLGPKFKENL